MAIPESMLTGVAANIATDILKHHAQSLEGTLVGRMLKWAGLIEPNYYERICDTLAEALELYLKTHPQYRLNCVIAFFRDAATARQIGDYILDRRAIDQSEIQQAIEKYLVNDNVGKVLIGSGELRPDEIIPSLLECYRQVLIKRMSIPQVSILMEIMDRSNAEIEEIRGSEERLKAVVQQLASRVNDQTELLERIATGVEEIKHRLGMDRSRKAIRAEITLSLDAASRSAIFESGGLCSGYILRAMPDSYFLAQEFREDRRDLRDALSKALAEFNVQPMCADDFLWPGPILCKISALIQGTPFGVYQLTSSQNRNIHLELGIAVGLGRPFILVKDREAEISTLCRGLDYYPIDSYLELKYEMGQKVRPFLTNVAEYRAHELPEPGSQRTAIIAHGDLDAIDFCVSVAKVIKEYGLTPMILGDSTSKISHYLQLEGIPSQILGDMEGTQLNEVIGTIQAARLGIYRIDSDSSSDTFLALGASIGLNRPGFLTHKSGTNVPSNLGGLSTLEFSSYGDLRKSILMRYGGLLKRYS